MRDSAEAATSSKLDIGGMTRNQKLAAFLIILGPESAGKVMKSFTHKQLEMISAEMARMPVITLEMRTQILTEMTNVARGAGSTLSGGLDFARKALAQAIGSGKASDVMNRVMNRVMPSSVAVASQKLQSIEVRPLVNLLKDEHVQTISLITSYLRPDRASEFMALLKPEVRDEVVERLATLQPTPADVVDKIVEVLLRRLSGTTERRMNTTGGVKAAAAVLNAMNKNLTKNILTSLEERNAQLGQAIRQKMFIFTDMHRLDVNALQKVMREVDMRDLALALKKADEVLMAKLMGAISKRAAETVKEEMGFMTAVKLKDVELAQTRIIEIVRKLESEGEIDLEVNQMQEEEEMVM